MRGLGSQRLSATTVIIGVVSLALMASLSSCSTGSAGGRPEASSPAPHTPHATVADPTTLVPNAASAPSYVAPTGPAPKRSGQLDHGSLPSPGQLGEGWDTFAEAGGAEAGWIGNGSFVHARDPHAAAFGVLPLGCAHRPHLRLPVPRHALQGSYHSAKSRPAQVVVLQFGSVPAATRYFRGFTRMLRACDRADGPGGVRVEPTRVRSESFLGRRHYVGARTWWEVDVRVGARVGVLLASDTIADQPAVARVLARAIRR